MQMDCFEFVCKLSFSGYSSILWIFGNYSFGTNSPVNGAKSSKNPNLLLNEYYYLLFTIHSLMGFFFFCWWYRQNRWCTVYSVHVKWLNNQESKRNRLKVPYFVQFSTYKWSVWMHKCWMLKYFKIFNISQWIVPVMFSFEYLFDSHWWNYTLN